MMTEMSRDVRETALWEAFVDMRRGNARHLRIAGLVLLDGRNLLYALEGPAENLDLFVRLLEFSPCEIKARTWWRQPITTRRYTNMTLSVPDMIPSERLWLSTQLTQSEPDMETLPVLMNWLRLHQ